MNRILIASGDRTVAEGAQHSLSNAGFQTAVITDSEQLLAFCGQHTPDLTVVDLNLPGGSIWTVAQAIRSEARLAGMPLVGMTDPLSEEERQQAMACGFAALENKPLDAASLVQTVQNALNSAAKNITPMPARAPAASAGAHDPVSVLLAQIVEIRELTVALKPGVATYGDEAPELFTYIENSGDQIHDELTKLAATGPDRSSIALQDKDLRHDFRNMIGSVTGFSELLLMEPSINPDAREKFTRIREICRSFCDILDQQKAAAA